MKKKVNTDAIMNELQGSVFFTDKQEHNTVEEFVNKSTNQQVSKSTNQFVNKSTNQQTDLSADQQNIKTTSQQTSKTLKRFGSYLTPESLKELKRIAFETDKKDYEVLQEAVNEYLNKVKK